MTPGRVRDLRVRDLGEARTNAGTPPHPKRIRAGRIGGARRTHASRTAPAPATSSAAASPQSAARAIAAATRARPASESTVCCGIAAAAGAAGSAGAAAAGSAGAAAAGFGPATRAAQAALLPGAARRRTDWWQHTMTGCARSMAPLTPCRRTLPLPPCPPRRESHTPRMLRNMNQITLMGHQMLPTLLRLRLCGALPFTTSLAALRYCSCAVHPRFPH